ncbi:hypothetical protein [Rhodococcus sp. DMU1]|uniref:hypothetical protein n=1 Tax=Rhodococcus sp. DMU1 TaxID=2722825 RepID=UPI00143E710F|nr:hypothetical protein [Rhodococcus sp. DMU1]QIX53909.1 hypothetical protein HFP48_30600 [Rhodococcus sp. DMU1]
MTTGGRQDFAWVDQHNAPLGEVFLPNPTWRAHWRDRSPHSPTIGVLREDTGRYQVTVGGHNPFRARQAQVVAYGTDNARCKFYQRPEPEAIERLPDGRLGWVSRMFVSCVNAAGAAVNSKFVLSFSGEALEGTPPLAGPAAFFETTAEGTAIARNYKETSDGRFTAGNGWMSFNSASSALPTIRHQSTGIYRVSIPRLGTPTPGLAQVTALGPGITHCQAGPPIASPTDPTSLLVDVSGWAGVTLANTDFVLNYDHAVTRISPTHQGARAHANRSSTTSYTPARSYNSGAIIENPGTNTAYRRGVGLYRIHHSEIRSTPNSVWIGAAPSFGPGYYCKVESWNPSSSATGRRPGTDVYVRCYNADGELADSPYYETFQGIGIGPT